MTMLIKPGLLGKIGSISGRIFSWITKNRITSAGDTRVDSAGNTRTTQEY